MYWNDLQKWFLESNLISKLFLLNEKAFQVKFRRLIPEDIWVYRKKKSRSLKNMESINFRFLGGACTSICHFFRPSISLSVAHHISGTVRHLIIIYGTLMLNDDISRHFFHFFKILIFWAVRGVKGQKTAQNDKKFCLSHFISQEPYIRWL